MKPIIRSITGLKRRLIAGALLALPLSALAAEVNCAGPANVEEYHYTWRLRGGLGWIAGFVFPRNGEGELKTIYAKGDLAPVESQLLITSGESKNGFYTYESQMDPDAKRTLMTYHGYSWGNKSRKERTVFDSTKKLARVHKETPKGVEDRVKMLPDQQIRDVLTAIQFLRLNADTIKGPITTSIYSDGTLYPVIFRPADPEVFTLHNERVNGLGFEITDAPGGKRWPGGVRVWLSADPRRIPFRIEIVETLASLQLDLRSVQSCGFLNTHR